MTELPPELSKLLNDAIMEVEFQGVCKRMGIDPKTVPSPSMLSEGKGKRTTLMTHGVTSQNVRIRYYRGRRTGNLYRWTVGSIWFNGKMRYVGMFYRYYKSKRMWKLTKVIAMRRKNAVKAKLIKLYNRYEKVNQPTEEGNKTETSNCCGAEVNPDLLNDKIGRCSKCGAVVV